jgi:hypothetical protein
VVELNSKFLLLTLKKYQNLSLNTAGSDYLFFASSISRYERKVETVIVKYFNGRSKLKLHFNEMMMMSALYFIARSLRIL